MVEAESKVSEEAVPPPAPFKAEKKATPRRWIVPGEEKWEVWDLSPRGDKMSQASVIDADGGGDVPQGDVVALPATLVTCQLFWLETTDRSAIKDLVLMQCERRSLLREDEIWTHRVVRQQDGRSLVQVLILKHKLPEWMDAQADAAFEAHARCHSLTPNSLKIRRSLKIMSMVLADEEGEAIYFQALPHTSLSLECLKDIRSVLWLATAQGWVKDVSSLEVEGDWTPEELESAGKFLAVPVSVAPESLYHLPEAPMPLTPSSVEQLRRVRRRDRRIRLAVLGLAALYVIFLVYQIGTGVFLAVGNARLQSKLDAIMPEVTAMQNTARQWDALNPALDVGTYPLELLYRVMSALPDQGVRLTRFEINGDRLEIGGESTTAREAFDYIEKLETLESLNHITWEEPPQPIPLPNDTTRFSIQGTIAGAYHENEET